MMGGGGATGAAPVGMPSQATVPVRRRCEGTAMGAITLDLRPGFGVGPFTLGESAGTLTTHRRPCWDWRLLAFLPHASEEEQSHKDLFFKQPFTSNVSDSSDPRLPAFLPIASEEHSHKDLFFKQQVTSNVSDSSARSVQGCRFPMRLHR
jgi:hypothetical protein